MPCFPSRGDGHASSDVRKVLNFARDCEHLSGDQLIERCIAEGVGVIQSPNYNPFAGRTEMEKLEWHVFLLFLSFDRDAGRAGGEPERVTDHVEWILERPFQNVGEWLGEEGDKFRGRKVPEQFKAGWAVFFDKHRHRELADVIKELETLQKQFEQTLAEGRLHSDRNRSPKRHTRRRRAELEAAE